MSEETAQRLQMARTEENRLRSEADKLQQQLLADVAAGIPERVDKVAKRAAQAQPEAAKKLGAAGIRTLRAELAEAAATLASQVANAGDAIEWPRKSSEFNKVTPRDIHSALFKVMYGQPVNAVAAIFKRHGFDIQDDSARRSQGLVYPQSLYDEDSFGPLAASLNAVGDAEREVAKAKADDDRDIVESLWED